MERNARKRRKALSSPVVGGAGARFPRLAFVLSDRHREWVCINPPCRYARGRRDQGGEWEGHRGRTSCRTDRIPCSPPGPCHPPASTRRLHSHPAAPSTFRAAYHFPPPGDIYDIMDALDAGYGNAYSGDDVYDYPGSEFELEIVQRDTRTLVAASRAWRAARGVAAEGGEEEGQGEGEEVKRGGRSGGRAAGGRGRPPSATWSDVDPDPDRMALKLGLQGERPAVSGSGGCV